MYEVVDFTPWQVFVVYFVFLGASIVTYPIISLIYRTVSEVVNRWK